MSDQQQQQQQLSLYPTMWGRQWVINWKKKKKKEWSLLMSWLHCVASVADAWLTDVSWIFKEKSNQLGNGTAELCFFILGCRLKRLTDMSYDLVIECQVLCSVLSINFPTLFYKKALAIHYLSCFLWFFFGGIPRTFDASSLWFPVAQRTKNCILEGEKVFCGFFACN